MDPGDEGEVAVWLARRIELARVVELGRVEVAGRVEALEAVAGLDLLAVPREVPGRAAPGAEDRLGPQELLDRGVGQLGFFAEAALQLRIEGQAARSSAK